MTIKVPVSHQDLLIQPINGVLTTMMSDGQPQMSMVWADYDGEHVLINTTLERQKTRNMGRNPKVNVLLIDPENGSRFLEVRGEVVEIIQNGAIAHADKQTQAYSQDRKQWFYGDVYPEERLYEETRVIVKIAPTKVNINAIFS